MRFRLVNQTPNKASFINQFIKTTLNKHIYMKLKYMTCQNTQWKFKPNKLNEALVETLASSFFTRSTAVSWVRGENPTVINGGWGFLNSRSAVGIFVHHAFIIWCHLSTQLHQELHNKASLSGSEEHEWDHVYDLISCEHCKLEPASKYTAL